MFLQEPHVKESCGGLRDYQNVKWLARVKKGYRNLDALVKEKILTKTACKAMRDAYDFVHRVRTNFISTQARLLIFSPLQLQGVVATHFKYPQKSILRRCEAFMRDYYRHTKALHQHTTSYWKFSRSRSKKKALLHGIPGLPKEERNGKSLTPSSPKTAASILNITTFFPTTSSVDGLVSTLPTERAASLATNA